MLRSSLIEPKEVFQFRKGGESRLEWKVPLDLPYFQGHFPLNPILPGIAMIDASLEAYRLLHDLENAPFIKKIHSAKFTGLVKPNDELTLMLDERNGMQWVTLYKEGIQTAEIVFEVS